MAHRVVLNSVIHTARVGVAGVAEVGGCGKDLFGALHSGGIESGYEAALGEEHFHEIDRGGFADVVGLALEGQAEDANAFATQRP